MNLTTIFKAERKTQHPVNVLIIDDDIDSALQVESVFAHLGCQTTCALNWHDAQKQICALKPEVIIFDWILDQHTDAGDIVSHCSKTFAKFASEPETRAWHKPKIITYSSLQESEIKFLETPYFDHLQHWQKPIQQRDLLGRALDLLTVIGR